MILSCLNVQLGVDLEPKTHLKLISNLILGNNRKFLGRITKRIKIKLGIGLHKKSRAAYYWRVRTRKALFGSELGETHCGRHRTGAHSETLEDNCRNGKLWCRLYVKGNYLISKTTIWITPWHHNQQVLRGLLSPIYPCGIRFENYRSRTNPETFPDR